MADSRQTLAEYGKKRDFRATPEPKSGSGAKTDTTFVIQKHDASQLHYDFRLSVDGVLKSWSVPKGPSLNPGEKRLAIETEDHPLDYAEFEGAIPEEQYGGGTVIVWDTGGYQHQPSDDKPEQSVAEALDGGDVRLWLEGEKLKGGFALVRMNEKKGEWLLIKAKDEHANRQRNLLSAEPQSVLSGKTNDDMENG